eukprot:scaffold3178_cov109-Isochrysis_galbana.AAC.8
MGGTTCFVTSRWAGASQGEKVVGGMNHLLCACGTAGGGEGERGGWWRGCQPRAWPRRGTRLLGGRLEGSASGRRLWGRRPGNCHRVRDGLGRSLPFRLEHTQRVGGAVRDTRGPQPKRGRPEQPQPHVALWRRGQPLVECIVGEEPRVGAHERRTRRRKCALEERSGTFGAGLGKEQVIGGLAAHLQRRLQRVDRRQPHPPHGRCAGGDCGPDSDRQTGSRATEEAGVGEQQHDAGVGGGVAEPAERRLHQRKREAAVQPPHPTLEAAAALGVNTLQGVDGRHLLIGGVLIVHGGAQPHERQHLGHARKSTAHPTAQRSLPSLGQDVTEGRGR